MEQDAASGDCEALFSLGKELSRSGRLPPPTKKELEQMLTSTEDGRRLRRKYQGVEAIPSLLDAYSFSGDQETKALVISKLYDMHFINKRGSCHSPEIINYYEELLLDALGEKGVEWLAAHKLVKLASKDPIRVSKIVPQLLQAIQHLLPRLNCRDLGKEKIRRTGAVTSLPYLANCIKSNRKKISLRNTLYASMKERLERQKKVWWHPPLRPYRLDEPIKHLILNHPFDFENSWIAIMPSEKEYEGRYFLYAWLSLRSNDWNLYGGDYINSYLTSFIDASGWLYDVRSTEAMGGWEEARIETDEGVLLYFEGLETYQWP